MSDLELWKRKTEVGKQGVRSLFIFEITKWKLNSDFGNLISFSVIYRFIGLRHEITEICSINRKHRSNWTVTLTNQRVVFLVSQRCHWLKVAFHLSRLTGPTSQFLNGTHEFSELDVLQLLVLLSAKAWDFGKLWREKMYARALDFRKFHLNSLEPIIFGHAARTGKWNATSGFS